MTQCRCRGAGPGVLRGKAEGLPLDIRRPQDRDVERGVEQDHGRVEGLPSDVDPDARAAGHDVRIGHQISGAHHEAGPRQQRVARDRRYPGCAVLGWSGDGSRLRIRRHVHRGCGERFEADEDLW